ncbi:MAG: DinB family protein [Dehalococcoidia bacterium]
MDQSERQVLITRYVEGPRVVEEALARIGADRLDVRAEDGWTAREVVHHLADSEMTSAIRLRRLIAEDRPEIVGYDEPEYARRLYYDRPIETSLAAVKAARASTATILERMIEDEWQREGTHSESGRYSVEDWLRIYAAHAHEHAAQIARAGGAAVS